MAMSSGIFLSKAKSLQLEEFSKTTKNKTEYRAAIGVLLRSKGKTAKDAGNQLGATQKQVFTWCRKFREEGIKGLLVKKQTGRPAEQKNQAKPVMEELLKKDPQMFGYLKGRWVLRDISRELKKEGIDLHYTGVRRALLDLGIVLKSPKLRAPGSINKNYRKRAEIKRYKRVSSALLKKK